MKSLLLCIRTSAIHAAHIILIINFLTPFGARAEIVRGISNYGVDADAVQVTASSGNTGPVLYNDLTTAFAAINDGTHKGAVVITISANTIETTTAVLNASGTSGAVYSSVIVSPTAANITITGNLNAPIIRLNGADNVTFDGSIGGSGTSRDLSITNTNLGITASTIEYVAGATNNTIRYCNLSGSNAIISAGASGNLNSTNTIEHSAIADFLNPAIASNGIFLGPFNEMWTLFDNHFYQSTTLTALTDVEYSAIRIAAGTNNGFIIQNNSIGGNNPSGTGNWVKSSSNTPFFGIYYAAGNGSNTIQNNTIHNFQWTNSGSATWSGIHIQSGTALISGNIIGAATGTGNIQVTMGANTAPSNGVFGISHASTIATTIEGNTIGAITSNNSNSSSAANIYGIMKLTNAATLAIENNIVSQLQASSISLGNSQLVYGIAYEITTGSSIISGNTVSDLINLSANTNGEVHGIQTNLASNTIINNIVKNLTTPSPNSSNGSNASVIGIKANFTNSDQQISGNTIYNMSNTSTTQTKVIGIYINGSQNLNNRISENFIHTLSVSTAGSSPYGEIFGIRINSGSATYSNNIINLGVGVDSKSFIYGIYDPGNVPNNQTNYYFNTIYIGGTSSGFENNSYAFFVGDNKANIKVINNIFHNERNYIGQVSYHCAVHYQTNANGLNADYNVYYYPHGVFVRIGPPSPLTLLNTLADWQTLYPFQDLHSVVGNSNFSSPGGTTATNYIPANQYNGLGNTNILKDYADVTRSCASTRGAFERASVSVTTPQFVLGPTSNHCLDVGSTFYLTRVLNAASFNYSIDATSLANQVTINSLTGEVTYPVGWSGATTITITATSCDNTTTTATHVATAQPIIYTNFSGTGNWSDNIRWNNGIPVSCSYATINGEATLNIDAIIKEIIISPQATLTLKNQTLNAEKITIKSDATGTGSVIGNSINLQVNQAVAERYISGSPEAWHLLSSPVPNQLISPDFTPTGSYGDGSGYDFYAWSEPTVTWLNQKVGTNNITTFTPGKGYLIAYQDPNPTKIFTGSNFNNGLISMAITKSSNSVAFDGANLIGNPYPSSIDWKSSALGKGDLIGGSAIGHTMYIYNDQVNNYGTYNDLTLSDEGSNSVGRYIPPMQGFFVMADHSGSFTFDDGARVHSSKQWLKSGKGNEFRLSVQGPQNTGSDEILLDFGHELNMGGAEKWYSLSATAPSLYLPTPELDYSIRFLTSTTDNPLIPVSFKSGSEGDYSIHAVFNSSVFSSVKLIDRLNGEVQELTNNPEYGFTASAGDDADRFLISFGTLGIGTPEDANSFQVYSYDGVLYVNSASKEDSRIQVYNLTGQVVLTSNTGGNSLTTIHAPFPNGTYLVNIISRDGVNSCKVNIMH